MKKQPRKHRPYYSLKSQEERDIENDAIIEWLLACNKKELEELFRDFLKSWDRQDAGILKHHKKKIRARDSVEVLESNIIKSVSDVNDKHSRGRGI